MLVWPELISDWYVWTDSSNSWTSSVHDFLYSYRPIVEICHNVDHIVFNVSTSSPRKYLQCYWDFRILTVCNYWHVLAGKGFLNEHTLNYKYQHLDNIGIFYIIVFKKLKMNISFSFHSLLNSVQWSHKHCNNIEKNNAPFLTRNSISTCKSTDKIVQFAQVSTFHPPVKNRKPKGKNTNNTQTPQYLSKWMNRRVAERHKYKGQELLAGWRLADGKLHCSSKQDSQNIDWASEWQLN